MEKVHFDHAKTHMTIRHPTDSVFSQVHKCDDATISFMLKLKRPYGLGGIIHDVLDFVTKSTRSSPRTC